MPTIRRHLLPLLLILLATALLTRHIWGTRGWIETHDGIFHLIRLDAVKQAVLEGQFPVRWVDSLDNGFGLPLFNYVYPLPYYLGLPSLLLGLSTKITFKLLLLGFVTLGGVGVYTLFARRGRLIGLVSALLFISSPYLLLDIFVRGALGEILAIVLMPWVVISWLDLRGRGLRSYHPLPLALLLLSHNFLSFLFLPIYLYLILTHRKSLKASLLSLLLSFGLAAFFVLPMVCERGLVYSGSSGDVTYDYSSHFVYLRQLITSPWGAGYSTGGLGDGLSFALGGSYWALIILSLYLLPKLLLPLGLIVFFMLPVSRQLWALLTPLQYIQFPWRLLSFTTLFLPYLAYRVLSRLEGRSRLVISILLLLLALLPAIRYTRPAYLMNNAQLSAQLDYNRPRTTTSSRLELLPRLADKVERFYGENELLIVEGNAKLSLDKTDSGLKLHITTDDPSTKILLRRNFFPSWQIQADTGEHLALTPYNQGEILFIPLLGDHTYTAWVGSTPLEYIANIISLLCLALLILLWLFQFAKSLLATKYDGWDISIALRYLPIVKDLRARRRPRDRVLEVGSEITGITPYLQERVVGLDRGFDYSRQNKYLQPVKGSVLKLPFKDQEFAYSLAVDVLEHLRAGDRPRAVQEMFRVTKRRVYLSFPVGKEGEQIDRLLDQYFFDKHGQHYPYLAEHVANGLPGTSFVEDLLKHHQDWTLTAAVPNTSSWLWVLLLKLGLSNTRWQTNLYHRLLLLTPLLIHFNFGQTYRKLYILDRRPV